MINYMIYIYNYIDGKAENDNAHLIVCFMILFTFFFRTACFNFMLNHIDVNNCMGLLNIAERLDCKVFISLSYFVCSFCTRFNRFKVSKTYNLLNIVLIFEKYKFREVQIYIRIPA